jgi:hypothetical protein
MSEYKEIKGFKVQTLSTDPAATVLDTGSWASVASMNTARYQTGGSGIITAALAFGGYTTANVANTEQWNGSSWSEVNDLNAATRGKAGFGTYTAAIASGGNPPSTNNESWDGTNWTEVNELNTGRGGAKGVGTNTAGLVYGGYTTTQVAVNESWNGTSFTELADLNTGRNSLGGAGTQTAALAFNGGPEANVGSAVNDTESWNGSAWTTLTESSNTIGKGEGVGSTGTQTSALLFGGSIYGSSVPTGRTEAWNGSTWTELGDLGTGRSNGASSGADNTSAMYAGGAAPSTTGATEQWTLAATPGTFSKINLGQVYFNSTANAFKVTEQPVPGGSFSAGGNLNTAREGSAVTGTRDANIAAGGAATPGIVANTESYDGSAWTEVNDLPAARTNGGGTGTQTAALYISGQSPSTPYSTDVFSWDGTSWTDGTDVSSRHATGGAIGIQTAAIIAAGRDAPNALQPAVESWNGSAWTEIAELNETRRFLSAAGTQTAGMVMAGCPNVPPSPNATTAKTEQWDGSSWTEVGDLNTARLGATINGTVGTQTTSLVAGGNQNPPTASALTETWNGTAWTEQADLSSGRNTLGGAGAGATSMAAVGGSGPTASTEEWTVPEVNTTITVS